MMLQHATKLLHYCLNLLFSKEVGLGPFPQSIGREAYLSLGS